MVLAIFINPTIVPWGALAYTIPGIFSMLFVANVIVSLLVQFQDEIYCLPVDNLTMLLIAAFYELCFVWFLKRFLSKSPHWKSDETSVLKTVDWILDISTRLLGIQWFIEMVSGGIMGVHGWSTMSWTVCEQPRLLIFTSFYFMWWIFHFLWELSVIRLGWDLIAHHLLVLLFMVFLTDHSFEFIRTNEYRGTLFGAFIGGIVHGITSIPMSVYHCDGASQAYKYLAMRIHFYQTCGDTLIFHCCFSWFCMAYFGEDLSVVQKIFSFVPLIINSFIELYVLRTLWMAKEKKRRDSTFGGSQGSSYFLLEKP